ncbi:MAG: ABC transporter permease [Chloroflexi bacterium]|nr:ABC transporter permease [Chloroflexota bacterium]MBV9601301.1 ABC transporter permease [Chloroflexota bacterium]
MRHDLRVIRAVALKDIRSSLTERLFTVLSVILPINFLLLFLLFVLTGGEAPTAVVMDDTGPYAQQFLQALQGSNSFIIQTTDADTAQRLMSQGRIVAIITVPSDFDAALQSGQSVSLPVVINNLEVDYTNDIRRAVPLAITSFYAQAFPDQVVVQAQELDVQPHDTGYIAYLSVSIVVVSLLVGGLLQAGSIAAREYETGTIKELLLAPASRWAIQVGKVLASIALNILSAGLVLSVVVLLLGVRPEHWAPLIGFTLLVMLTFVALGLLLGTLVRSRTAVIPLSLGLALPIFFMSGAFGPVQWGTPLLAAVAQLQPVYYAIAVFQYAFHGFQTTPFNVTFDALALAGFTVVIVAASALALRQRRATP